MATATQQPKITFLPPGPHRPELETHQNLAVFRYANTTDLRAGGEWENNAVDFSDYGRMRTFEAKLDSGRRLERPDWAVNNQQLAKVLACAMEARANMTGGRGRFWQPGTPAERIKRAQEKIKAHHVPRQIETLDGLCKEYVELKNSPAATHDRLRELEIEIEGLDTTINANQKDSGLGQFVGCVQTYYRECLTSVECGERLHIKPPLVRATIFRLAKAAETAKNEVRVSMRINLLRGLHTNPVAVPGKGQHQCWVCGCLFLPDARVKGDTCRKPGCRKKYKEREKEKLPRQPQKFYCGPACKDTARFAIKSLPVPVKPGVGLFVPIAGGDRYQNYLKFCMVIGTTPLTEEQWGMGCGPGSID